MNFTAHTYETWTVLLRVRSMTPPWYWNFIPNKTHTESVVSIFKVSFYAHIWKHSCNVNKNVHSQNNESSLKYVHGCVILVTTWETHVSVVLSMNLNFFLTHFFHEFCMSENHDDARIHLEFLFCSLHIETMKAFFVCHSKIPKRWNCFQIAFLPSIYH